MSVGSNGEGTSGFTILVAEDSEADALVLRLAYSKADLRHTLRFVQDGRQAIDYLRGKPPYSDRQQFPAPDLLLLDLKMPRVGGIEVLQWMQFAGLDRIPVLVLSGSVLEIDQFQAMRLGAREYHVKPASVDATVKFLKDASERWLKHAASSGEVTAPRAHLSSPAQPRR